MQDESVRVAVMFLERELRRVVSVNLFDRIFQSVERVVHWLGWLRQGSARESVEKWSGASPSQVLTLRGALTLPEPLMGLRIAILRSERPVQPCFVCRRG